MAEHNKTAQNLEDVIGIIRDLADTEDEVSVGDVQDAIGKRSFAPFLLIGGLFTLSPVGAIPGVPTLFGLVVLLTAGQMLIGRDYFWLPKSVESRAIDDDRIRKAADKLENPARRIDRFLKPRLTILTEDVASYLVALTCVALALTMPVLEAVPFAVAVPAAAISAFALALVSKDGLLAILGYLTSLGSLYLVANTLLF